MVTEKNFIAHHTSCELKSFPLVALSIVLQKLSLVLLDLLSHLASWFLLDDGVIVKILEDGSKAFIISETHLCNGSAPVHSMKLDSEKVIKQSCASL